MTEIPDIIAQQTIAAILNEGEIFPNHPSHSFTGIDGRCMDCDCRPRGRHAPNPCPVSDWHREGAS
jgi:hypothetical protein